MHEYSIVQALMDRVESEARARGASAVSRLRIRIGDLSGVDRDLLASAFHVFRERTICDAADLEIVPVAARWACPRCGRPIPTGRPLACRHCDAPARLVEGDEIVLERIEMEVA